MCDEREVRKAFKISAILLLVFLATGASIVFYFENTLNFTESVTKSVGRGAVDQKQH